MIRYLSCVVVIIASSSVVTAADRPNVLWITCEDMSPMLGCYGDKFASTPNIDSLAAEGVRYTNAFAYTGVCAPSRSCLITGVYPTRLGSLHMRSTTRLPEFIRCFPEYLREAGYYCSNNEKEDYNFKTPETTWNESSAKAHWRKRPKDTPFFSVVNFMTTHQSRVFGTDQNREAVRSKLAPEQRHDDDKVTVPPIHPDVPEFRREWAWYYDNVSLMDQQVGEVLKQLEADGLADDTIVFFFSDHGTGLPNIKMWAWDRSLRVPLIVRVPEKWKSWRPGAAGTATDRMVSFVDFAPTVLSLCDVAIPQHMQGTAFLGRLADAPRDYVYAGKDRQGECFDTIRSVHDKKLHYIRNFRPELPWAQFMSYVDQHPSRRAWQKLHDDGKLTGPAARFFETKPAEELYDVTVDKWETKNLADDPQYTADLKRMRDECEAWMLRTGDLGLLPEYELHKRAKDSTPYEIATDEKLNPLRLLLQAASTANARDPKNEASLFGFAGDNDAAVGWWGMLGLSAATLTPEVGFSHVAATRPTALMVNPDAFVVQAAIIASYSPADGLEQLEAALKHESPFIRVSALNVLGRMGADAASLIPAIKNAKMTSTEHPDAAEYVGRMVDYLPERIEAAAAKK